MLWLWALKWSMSRGVSDSVNGCFAKISQTVAGSAVVGQMVSQRELMWL